MSFKEVADLSSRDEVCDMVNALKMPGLEVEQDNPSELSLNASPELKNLDIKPQPPEMSNFEGKKTLDESWKSVGIALLDHKSKSRATIIRNNKLIAKTAKPLCEKYNKILKEIMVNEKGWRAFVKQTAMLPELVNIVKDCERRLHRVVAGLDKIDKMCKKRRQNEHETVIAQIDYTIQLELEQYQKKRDKELIVAQDRRNKKHALSNLKRRREQAIQDAKMAPASIFEGRTRFFRSPVSSLKISSQNPEVYSDPYAGSSPSSRRKTSEQKSPENLPPGDAFRAWLETGGWSEYLGAFLRAGWGPVQLLGCQSEGDLLMVGVRASDSKQICDWLKTQRGDLDTANENAYSNDSPPTSPSEQINESASPLRRLVPNLLSKEENVSPLAEEHLTSCSESADQKEIVLSFSTHASAKKELSSGVDIVQTKNVAPPDIEQNTSDVSPHIMKVTAAEESSRTVKFMPVKKRPVSFVRKRGLDL